MSARCPLSTE
ncbi:unnamed protein product, partial [Didymodactylos carnosus]